jgi:hypothetical protein
MGAENNVVQKFDPRACRHTRSHIMATYVRFRLTFCAFLRLCPLSFYIFCLYLTLSLMFCLFCPCLTFICFRSDCFSLRSTLFDLVLTFPAFVWLCFCGCPGGLVEVCFATSSNLGICGLERKWSRGTDFSQLPSKVICTVDHPLGSPSLDRCR